MVINFPITVFATTLEIINTTTVYTQTSLHVSLSDFVWILQIAA